MTLNGDVKDVKYKEGGSGKTGVIAVTFMVATAGLIYVLGDITFKNYILAKPAFICTKIEQVGKNLDDVTCVQYTHQKYSSAAVAVNELVIVGSSK